jgi:predicted dehydrogenase/threonine dehydrogenase-like Zn-dependent dehydrogenase
VKQVLQNPRTGALELVDVPAPACEAGMVSVRNLYSVVSPGTEAMALAFGRASLVGKARSRPDLVRQVLRKLEQEGPLATYRTVMGRLEAPQPLGYSSAGIVEEVGAGVTGFVPGDRVACAGAGYANHAERIAVPENLVARVPDGVPLEHAAFATLGAIALQGLRVAQPTLGEVAAVIGLGLIGQLAVQLLRANGCRVLGLDLDAARVREAAEQGAEWAFTTGELPSGWKDAATGGHGVDLALVAASAESSAPLALAAELCRMKGRISVVGAVAMDLERRPFYDKELELRMSMSYGPGRYQRAYEERGLDYPLAYVRWTENRNLQAFLALLASGAVQPARLPSETVPFAQAVEKYEELVRGERRSLAMLFAYPESSPAERVLPLAAAPAAAASGAPGVAFIGAGNYAKAVLLPALAGEDRARRVALVTATGASARRAAEKFGFAACGTDAEAVLADPAVRLVFVATRHDSHARLAERALRAGKAVWLEKPVGLTREEVEAVARAAAETRGFLAVGYNRRFSPHARAVRGAFEGRSGPLAIHYTIAAGPPPRGTWITDPEVGGGRIVGEACHFVDLCAYLVGAPPVSVSARRLSRDPESDDSLVALLAFPDGSAATLSYLAKGDPALPKERFEVSGEGRTARCDNFRSTEISGRKRLRTLNQDKGQAAAIAEVLSALREGRPSPFELSELVAVSSATFALLESAASGRTVPLADG